MTEVTENTINDLVADFLRSRNLLVNRELSARIGNDRRQPDFELLNDVILYGEGEWNRSYAAGLTQAIDFGEIPGSSGYFLIGYPEALRKQVAKLRLTSKDPAVLLGGIKLRGLLKVKGSQTSIFPSGTIEEFPEWFTAALERKPKKDPDEYVRIMQDLVTGLSNFLTDEPTRYPSLFENVVSSLSDKKGKQAATRKAAAYLLLNQIVFYHVISKEGRVPPLDESKIKAPGDLFHLFFRKVTMTIDYHAVFDFDVASIFPKKSTQSIVDTIRVIKELAPEDFTRNLLGSMFHRLIPREVRKPLAAYYTNPAAASLLANLAVENHDERVADMACGSGTLLVAAYDRKAALLGKTVTETVHKRFVQRDITGIDVMPFAAHLAVVQLGLKNPGFLTDKVRIGVRDSTDLNPESRIDPLQMTMETGQRKIHDFEGMNLAKLLKKTGAISGEGSGDSFVMGDFDIVLMNPPFSRKQHITRDLRAELNRRFKDYQGLVSDEQNYNLYFVFLADRFLKDKSRIAMVLPATMLNQKSSKGFRKLIRRDYIIEYVILTEYRSAFSEDTSFRDMLFIAAKSRSATIKRDAVFAVLKVLPADSSSGLIEASLKEFTEAARRSMDNSLMRAAKHTQEDVFSSDNWYQLIPGELRSAEADYGENVAPLSTQAEKIIQGFRFESSSDMVNTRDTLISLARETGRINLEIQSSRARQFIVKSSEREEPFVVPRKVTAPAMRTVAGQDTIEIDEPKDFVILDRFPNDDDLWTQTSVDKMLVRRREHIKTRQCHLVMAGYGNVDMGSPGTYFCAFCSKSKIAPTWSMWSIRCHGYDDAVILALWINSSIAIAELVENRTEVRGTVMKWRKGVLENLPSPNLGDLSDEVYAEGAMLLARLNKMKFPCLLEQLETSFEGRMEIDRFAARLMGVELGDNDLVKIQKDLASQLGRMQAMMKRD